MARVARLELGAELARVQAALRRMLGSAALTLETPRPGGTVQARVGAGIVGTLDVVADEDGRSWVLTVPVLQDDLA